LKNSYDIIRRLSKPILRSSNSGKLMSALGQKRTWRDQIAMSALPAKADIPQRQVDVRFGPKAEVPDR
jgi:hypothetical protein